jgi:hypothetical protein
VFVLFLVATYIICTDLYIFDLNVFGQVLSFLNLLYLILIVNIFKKTHILNTCVWHMPTVQLHLLPDVASITDQISIMVGYNNRSRRWQCPLRILLRQLPPAGPWIPPREGE